MAHFDSKEKHIARLPQFTDVEILQMCLNQTSPDVSLSDCSASEYKYEFVIENQRGTTISGNHIYTTQSIYPLDPPKLQTLWGDRISSLSMYPDPGLEWKWGWNKWHILKLGDLDEDGWFYSNYRFGSKHWIGVGTMGKFVRRRILVRLAMKAELEFDCLDQLAPLMIDNDILCKKVSKLDTFKGIFMRRKTTDSDQMVETELPTTAETLNNVDSVTYNESSEEYNVEGEDAQSVLAPSSAKPDVVWDSLITSLDNIHVDRLKAAKLLDFIFESNDEVLEHTIHNSLILEKILLQFTFKESKASFLNKFHERLNQKIPEDKYQVLFQLHNIVKQSLANQA